ncbi:hypothetical protein Pcinc_030034 [Petrolisthes cinctipes]|uniref:Uncharacterized protein n=1 Tax=Petrolisthes cinctipes TaxID=88211 RepID=A0AAE1EZ69_PETCI|nr:hypothetical protein Pcinc_030034 [Petrolisthes cinctipes]
MKGRQRGGTFPVGDSRELDTLVTANILSSSSPCLERQEDRGGGDNGMEVLRRFEAESMAWKNVNPFPRNMRIKKTLNGKVLGECVARPELWSGNNGWDREARGEAK